jgi:hypothetical protein
VRGDLEYLEFIAESIQLVLRPVPDHPAAAAVGAFATQIAVLGPEEAKRLDREEELDAQEHDRH